jgi:hypothetical protein
MWDEQVSSAKELFWLTLMETNAPTCPAKDRAEKSRHTGDVSSYDRD